MLVPHVQQLHLVVEVPVALAVGELEVEDADGVYPLELEVPYPLHRLLLYGEGGVVDAPVLEERLVGVLHLHDDLLPPVVLALDVEHAVARVLHHPYVLVSGEGDIPYPLVAVQNGVEKADEQVLVGLCGEKPLEAEVEAGADVPPVVAA